MADRFVGAQPFEQREEAEQALEPDPITVIAAGPAADVIAAVKFDDDDRVRVRAGRCRPFRSVAVAFRERTMSARALTSRQ
jgi:hypothetical protein